MTIPPGDPAVDPDTAAQILASPVPPGWCRRCQKLGDHETPNHPTRVRPDLAAVARRLHYERRNHG